MTSFYPTKGWQWITLHGFELICWDSIQIVHDDLGYSKISCRRVPKMSGQKRQRTNAGVISRKESSCIMTMQGLTQQPKQCRPWTTWAGNCFLISFIVQTLSLQTLTCLVPCTWEAQRENFRPFSCDLPRPPHGIN